MIVTLEQVKMFLQITGDAKDDLIEALIPEVEADYLLIRNREFDDDSNDDIEYPAGSALVAAQMIGFLMSDMMKSGGVVKSESIGSYSWTADDLVNGYPKAIVRRIKRYINAK